MEQKHEKQKYGYMIYPGNNSAAIQNALKKRLCWVAYQDKEILNASFFWKQLNYSPKIYDDFEQILKVYPNRHVLLNHFENNHLITTKSGLLKTLKYYYTHQYTMIDQSKNIFDSIPRAFFLKSHKEDSEYKEFKEKFYQIENKNFHKIKVPEKHCEHNVWFIKPESDNQGKGIILSNNWKQIENFLANKPVNSGWIVQKAIEKPLLYQSRKFDLRVWILVTPHFQVYYYNTPYMRTTSTPYNCDSLSSEIHLTNNCQQKHFSQYSKYEDGNTVPFIETFTEYINGKGQNGEEIVAKIIEKMKQLVLDTLMSVRKHFSKGKKKQFQLFGYDFLIDEDYRTWLLEVNNNPYLGVPNNFIKELLPLMIDEMLEIVIDPYFPPENYTPVEQKKFEIIYKETSSFRISPIRVASTQKGYYSQTKRQKSISYNKLQRQKIKSELYNIGKDEKAIKPIYSTPAETLKYLLDNYCFNDLDPFILPSSLILGSNSLVDQSSLETNIKKLKMITDTRISKILLEPKIHGLVTNILCQDHYNQKIKAILVIGLANACKNFKSRIFVIKNFISILAENIKMYKMNIDINLLQSIIKLLIATGGFFDRSIFIPGQSRQNEVVRDFFVRSNSFTLLLYLKKKYANVLTSQINNFIDNISKKDWELFYEVSENKAKRAYSPKVNTAPEDEEENIMINTSTLVEEKPKLVNFKLTNMDTKSFRSRRYSGAVKIFRQ